MRAAALGIAILAGVWLFADRGALRPNAFGYDFVSFYCAASVALDGEDPYRTEPLRSCEHHVGRQFRPDSKLVVPAPLPGYALLILAPFAKLPYPVAFALWLALSLAAYVVCVVTLVRFSGLSPPVVVAATALSLGYVSVFLGQLVPVALAALCLAALAAERERWWSPAACCAIAALEPQFALPATAALFIVRPAMRIPLALIAGILVALSIALLGIPINLEYLTHVAHAQVVTEIVRSDQLSPIAIAYRLGMSAGAATTLGTFSYAFTLVAGVVLGIVVERRSGSRAALILIPPAVALLGAPYVHVHHLAFAIPAAFFLVGRTQWKGPALVAIFCLSIPLVVPYDLVPVAPLAALAVAILATGVLGMNRWHSAAFGIAVAAVTVLVQSALVTPVPPPPSAYAAIHGTDLAQSAWGIMIASSFHGNRTMLTLFALPVWIGLAAIVAAALRTRNRTALKSEVPISPIRLARLGEKIA